MSSVVDAGRGTETSIARGRMRLSAAVHSPVAAWVALALVLVAGAAVILYLTRSTTLHDDEWFWVQYRRGWGASTLLGSYNGHLALVPILIYHLLFAAGGLHTYVPYRLAVAAADVLAAALMFVYVRRRVSELAGLLAAGSLLVFGPGWQDILWPFQIAWLIAIAAGTGALMMLDRTERLGDLLACVLLTVSVASSSVGVAVALGVTLEIAWTRRRFSDAWIVAIPLGLYVLWSLGYQHATLAGSVFNVVQYGAQSAAVSLSSLLGLSGINSLDSVGTLYTLGAPLAVVAVCVMGWIAHRREGWPVRAVTLTSILLVFWALTAIGRSDLGAPDSSRYLYVDAYFVLLLAAELARGVTLRWRGQLALAALAAAAALSNLGVLRSAAGELRAQAALTKADLGALELGRATVSPEYTATSFPGYPFIVIRAGPYFAAQRALGSAADTPGELLAAPKPAQVTADAELAQLHGVSLMPTRQSAAGAGPTIDQLQGESAARASSCVALRPTAVATGQTNQAVLTIPPTGVSLSAAGAGATARIRRFGPVFHPIGTLPAGASATIRPTPDSAIEPWQLQLLNPGAIRACTLS